MMRMLLLLLLSYFYEYPHNVKEDLNPQWQCCENLKTGSLSYFSYRANRLEFSNIITLLLPGNSSKFRCVSVVMVVSISNRQQMNSVTLLPYELELQMELK